MHLNHLLASLALTLPALASTSISQLGCYSTVPALKVSEQFDFQSHGYCEQKCQKAGYRVAALSDGSTCACSNELPKDSDKVDEAQCNAVCTGFPQDKCELSYAIPKQESTQAADVNVYDPGGGKSAYTVLSTGEYASVSNDGSSTATADIIVAPTNINPSSVPTGILTAPGSGGYKGSPTSTGSKSAGSSAAVTSVSTSASASPTPNAAEELRAGSSVLGAVLAGVGLLL